MCLRVAGDDKEKKEAYTSGRPPPPFLLNIENAFSRQPLPPIVQINEETSSEESVT